VVVENGLLKVNGSPILLRGVNRHEFDTDHGRTVSENQPQQLTAPAGEVFVTRLPPGFSPSVGDELTVSRVSPAGSDRVVRAQWDSLYWTTSMLNAGG